MGTSHLILQQRRQMLHIIKSVPVLGFAQVVRVSRFTPRSLHCGNFESFSFHCTQTEVGGGDRLLAAVRLTVCVHCGTLQTERSRREKARRCAPGSRVRRALRGGRRRCWRLLAGV